MNEIAARLAVMTVTCVGVYGILHWSDKKAKKLRAKSNDPLVQVRKALDPNGMQRVEDSIFHFMKSSEVETQRIIARLQQGGAA